MTVAVLVARVLLFSVLVIAAGLKAADLDGARSAMRDFGLAPRVAGLAGAVLPPLELTVGVLILLQPTAVVGGGLAAGLMVVFALGTAWTLRRGRRPDCHCFGRLHRSPIGWPTVARNVLLGGTSVLIVVAGANRKQPNPLGWVDSVSPVAVVISLGVTALAAIFALQLWFIVHLLQQNGRILSRLEALEGFRSPGKPHRPERSGVPIGTSAPDFSLPRVDGARVALGDLLEAGRPVVLIFSDPNCGPCNAFLPSVAEWQRRLRHQVTLAVVSRGDTVRNATKADELALENVLIQTDREVAHAFGAGGTPSAVLIDRDGRVGSRAAVGARAIDGLLAGALLPEKGRRLSATRRLSLHAAQP